MADKPVGGFGRREDLWAGYEAAGGEPVDRDRALFWEVFGSLRWGVMCAGDDPDLPRRRSHGGAGGDRPANLGDRN